jgi:hypothetical protein
MTDDTSDACSPIASADGEDGGEDANIGLEELLEGRRVRLVEDLPDSSGRSLRRG